MQIKTKKGRVAVWSASAAVSVVGIAIAGFSLAWVAGSLGISGAAASQIVRAIEIGGAALAVVIAIFGGGVISAIAGVVAAYLRKKLRAVAIA